MGTPYFGTDGIRGRANIAPMTAETAMRVGMAAGRVFKRGNYRHRVVIGKDTRLSGYMLESAMVAGFTSVGIDVFLLGPMPTPAIAMLTRSLRADLGVMISASHNQYQDNGIKLFGPDGYKLTDELELKIETLIDDGFELGLAKPETLGRAKRIDDAQARYIEFAKRCHLTAYTSPSTVQMEQLTKLLQPHYGSSVQKLPPLAWNRMASILTVTVDPLHLKH
jgi:phosphoglucosamine mutase